MGEFVGGEGGSVQSDMAASNGVRQRRFSHLICTALRNDRTGRRYAISRVRGEPGPSLIGERAGERETEWERGRDGGVFQRDI